MNKENCLKIELKENGLSYNLGGGYSLDDMCLICSQIVLDLTETMVDCFKDRVAKDESTGFEKLVVGVSELAPELKMTALDIAYQNFQHHLCASILSKYEGENLEPMFQAALLSFGSTTTTLGEFANISKDDIALKMLEVAKGVAKLGEKEKENAD